MKSIFCTMIIGLFFMTVSGQNTTPAPTGDMQEVVATGMGAILAGDEVKAKDDAIAAALRNAVEQVVGMHVESDVLVQNYQTMEDKIYTRTSGYVQKYDVISSTKQLDSAIEVTIRAIVKVSDLQSDLSAIGVLISRKGKPRTMILIDEKNISEHYYHVMTSMNTTET